MKILKSVIYFIVISIITSCNPMQQISTKVEDNSKAGTANLPQASIPTFSITSGTYDHNINVILTTSTENALIYYTLDGLNPTKSSTKYSNPIEIKNHGTNITVKAIAIKDGFTDSMIATSNYSIQYVQVVQPVFSPIAGTYSNDINISISTTTIGATIKYTTNGTVPSATNGDVYSSSINLSNNGSTLNLKAIAYKTEMLDSPVTSGTFTINYSKVSTPNFNPTANTYNSNQNITISSTTADVTIKYTTDGSTPSLINGTVYGSPVLIDSNKTLKAIAYKTGMIASTIANAQYYFQPITPTFNPDGGSYGDTQTVTISTTASATIKYTIDGSEPSSSNGIQYSTPVSITSNKTLKAIAYQTGWDNSAVKSGSYTLSAATPTFTPGGGTYGITQNITISTTTPDSTIKYTMDGSIPSATNGEIYSPTTPIQINYGQKTLKAVVIKSSWDNSQVASATYNFTNTVQTPIISLASGNFSTPQNNVSIMSYTADAIIRYTIDGSIPTETNGNIYSTPITIDRNMTLKVLAYKLNWNNSIISTASYTFTVSNPSISLSESFYTGEQTATISSASPDVTIRYTTDSSIPTESNGTLYSSPIIINHTLQLKTIAYRDNWTSSSIIDKEYYISPRIQLTGIGSYSSLNNINSYPIISFYNETIGLQITKYIGSTQVTQTVDNDTQVGKYSAITIAQDNSIHISYYDEKNYDLKYAHWNGSLWATETIDSDGDVGKYTSIVLNSNSQPIISYYDATNKKIKYAKKTGASWFIGSIDMPSIFLFNNYTKISVDNNDYPHIYYSYQVKTDERPWIDYVVANNFMRAKFNGSNWDITNIYSSSTRIQHWNTYYPTFMAIMDSNYEPRMVINLCTQIDYYVGSVSYIYREGGTTKSISLGNYCDQNSNSVGIALDASQNPVIIYGNYFAVKRGTAIKSFNMNVGTLPIAITSDAIGMPLLLLENQYFYSNFY